MQTWQIKALKLEVSALDALSEFIRQHALVLFGWSHRSLDRSVSVGVGRRIEAKVQAFAWHGSPGNRHPFAGTAAARTG